MGHKRIPDRWGNYLPMGCRIAGTRFLPFKVPLKLELCQSQPESERFTPVFLLESTPMLKAVIDLTNTDRYYNSEEFTTRGVLYKKINVGGGGKLPSERVCEQFFDAVDQLCETLRHDSDALIGVHCTHGLNRTGYLICKYMVSRMKIDPQEAINNFQKARGYEIERKNYVQGIFGAHSEARTSMCPSSEERPPRNVQDIMKKSESRPRPKPSEENWRREPRLLPSQNNWGQNSSSSRNRYDPYWNYKYHHQTYNKYHRRYYAAGHNQNHRGDKQRQHPNFYRRYYHNQNRYYCSPGFY